MTITQILDKFPDIETKFTTFERDAKAYEIEDNDKVNKLSLKELLFDTNRKLFLPRSYLAVVTHNSCNIDPFWDCVKADVNNCMCKRPNFFGKENGTIGSFWKIL